MGNVASPGVYEWYRRLNALVKTECILSSVRDKKKKKKGSEVGGGII